MNRDALILTVLCFPNERKLHEFLYLKSIYDCKIRGDRVKGMFTNEQLQDAENEYDAISDFPDFEEEDRLRELHFLERELTDQEVEEYKVLWKKHGIHISQPKEIWDEAERKRNHLNQVGWQRTSKST